MVIYPTLLLKSPTLVGTVGISGLLRISATPEVAFQSAFTCAAGMVGLLRICATPVVAFQSELTCAAGIVGVLVRSL